MKSDVRSSTFWFFQRKKINWSNTTLWIEQVWTIKRLPCRQMSLLGLMKSMRVKGCQLQTSMNFLPVMFGVVRQGSLFQICYSKNYLIIPKWPRIRSSWIKINKGLIMRLTIPIQWNLLTSLLVINYVKQRALFFSKKKLTS